MNMAKNKSNSVPKQRCVCVLINIKSSHYGNKLVFGVLSSGSGIVNYAAHQIHT